MRTEEEVRKAHRCPKCGGEFEKAKDINGNVFDIANWPSDLKRSRTLAIYLCRCGHEEKVR